MWGHLYIYKIDEKLVRVFPFENEVKAQNAIMNKMKMFIFYITTIINWHHRYLRVALNLVSIRDDFFYI